MPSLPGGDRSRREYLKLIGGGGISAGTAAGLGITGGWSRYVRYLNEHRDRTCNNPEIAPSSSMETDDEINRILREYSEQNGGDGIQASIVTADGPLRSGVGGFAASGNCPMTLDYHLFVGSFTKTYTATLVMTQIEEGVLSLNDYLSDYVDISFSEPVRIEYLLNHTSGIPDVTDAGYYIETLARPNKRWEPAGHVDRISQLSLEFEPGTEHLYSNSNYDLLGVVLEEATGEQYGDILRATLQETVDHQDTYHLDYPDDLPIANGYDEDIFPLGRVNVTAHRRGLGTLAWTSGGIISNSVDASRFLHGIFAGRIVEPTTVDRMTRFVETPPEPRLPEGWKQVGYGFGIRHLQRGDQDLFGHTGTMPGYTTLAVHDRDRGYTIAILSNVSYIDRFDLFERLQRTVLGEGDG